MSTPNPPVQPPADPPVGGFVTRGGRSRDKMLGMVGGSGVRPPQAGAPAAAGPPAAPTVDAPAAVAPTAPERGQKQPADDWRPGDPAPAGGPAAPPAASGPAAPEPGGGSEDLDDGFESAPDSGLTREVKPLLPLSVIARFERFERRRRQPRAVILMDAIDHCHSTGTLNDLLAPPAVRPTSSLFPRTAPAHRRLPKSEKETQLSFRLTGPEREVIDGLVDEWSRRLGRKVPLSRLIAASLDGYLPKPKPKAKAAGGASADGEQTD